MSVAVELVLVASTRNCCLETTYSARVMATVSAEGGGGAGAVTVSSAVLATPPKEAEMVAEVDAVTDTVVKLNVVLVLPAGTVTLPIAGTLATAVLLLKRVTTAPPVGAAALKVTVPVEDAGPTTLVGLSARAESVTGGGGAGGETVSSVVLVTPPKEAEIVMVVDAVTEVVVTVKLAVVEPAATVTLVGAVAAPLLLERVTTVAAEGAALMVTVPCEELPPTTLPGLSAMLLRTGAEGAAGVQPDNVACVELPPPFTVTIQVGELKGWTWILKAPDASELPSAVPSTKIEWLGSALCPSRRSCPALSSARVIVGGGAGAATVNRAILVTPPKEAEMVTGVDATTEKVDTVNVTLLLPAGTVTLSGTVAPVVLLLERVTSAPPAGAAALKVTVPVEDAGPTTLVGLSARLESVTGGGGGGGDTGFTVKVADWVTPP